MRGKVTFSSAKLKRAHPEHDETFSTFLKTVQVRLLNSGNHASTLRTRGSRGRQQLNQCRPGSRRGKMGAPSAVMGSQTANDPTDARP
jgi:hypothetical protein